MRGFTSFSAFFSAFFFLGIPVADAQVIQTDISLPANIDPGVINKLEPRQEFNVGKEKFEEKEQERIKTSEFESPKKIGLLNF